MSNMKDYMMWLDNRGFAKWDDAIGELINPSGINVNSPKLMDLYKNDAQWHNSAPVELDDDDNIIEDEEELIIDDGDLDDCAYSPDEYWFHPDGGLTGDAYNFLYTLDSKGEFI